RGRQRRATHIRLGFAPVAIRFRGTGPQRASGLSSIAEQGLHQSAAARMASFFKPIATSTFAARWASSNRLIFYSI
ncbi:hypothetical protein, partial [Ensifer sp. SSB1]|uniref:hypothetical protein n=1 Tax=Ensifer sp. SSB1 TaxID=2795385 RepID=UPI0025C6124C